MLMKHVLFDETSVVPSSSGSSSSSVSDDVSLSYSESSNSDSGSSPDFCDQSSTPSGHSSSCPATLSLNLDTSSVDSSTSSPVSALLLKSQGSL